MTAEKVLDYTHKNNKVSWKESLKKNFLEAGLLYAAYQDSLAGNGRAAAEMINSYRKMQA